MGDKVFYFFQISNYLISHYRCYRNMKNTPWTQPSGGHKSKRSEIRPFAFVFKPTPRTGLLSLLYKYQIIV